MHRQLMEVSGWILIFLKHDEDRPYMMYNRSFLCPSIYIYVYIIPLRQLASGINESGIDFYFCEFAMLQWNLKVKPEGSCHVNMVEEIMCSAIMCGLERCYRLYP